MKAICKQCGKVKRMPKYYAAECTDCIEVRRQKRLEKARAIVATGKCPTCGAALRRNLALAGWWQCSQYGAEGFRADSSKPACNFQTFTE